MNIVVLVLSVVIIGLLIYLLLRPQRPQAEQSLMMLQNQIESLRNQTSDSLTKQQQLINQQLAQITSQINQQLQTIVQQLSMTTGHIGERLDKAATVISDVKKEIGGLAQASKQIFDVGKDIAKLSEILKAPKTRGLLGEFFLNDLLSQILPQDYYELQYPFKSAKVDAVVKLGPKLVPIDAKFPLENFSRIIESSSDDERARFRKEFLKDVRKHIDDIANKYILPDEGTYDFALMYIPAENVYYEVIIKENPEEKSVAKYALERKVIPVSPNSLYAYLQAIVLGLRGLKIEQSAEQILQALQKLTNDFDSFREDFETLGTHLRNAQGKYESAEKKLIKFDDKLSSLESISPEENIKKLT
ncbi:MAG: DNA recombination protein RmuC [candidate division WOR-3 bacterium]|nr:DNA recombination protein RmuC [candidate division WOR-3 bacterium]